MKFLKNYFPIYFLCIFANSGLAMEAATHRQTLQEKFYRLCQIIQPQPELLFAEQYRIKKDILKLPERSFGFSLREFIEEILSHDLQTTKSGFDANYLARNNQVFSLFFFAALQCNYFGHGRPLKYDAKVVKILSAKYDVPKLSVDPLLFIYRTTRGEKSVTLYGLLDGILEHAQTLHNRIRFDLSLPLTPQEKMFEKNYHFLNLALDEEFKQVLGTVTTNFIDNADKENLADIISVAIKQQKIDREWILQFMQSKK